MGALRNPLPNQQKDQYGRDPQSLSERLRKKTSYVKQTGYAPMFHAMVVDLRRVTRGQTCTNLILGIQALQDRSIEGGWTPAHSLEEWADIGYCDVKEVIRNRDYLKKRKMADCKVDTKRMYSFRLKPETWQALEDYRTWQAKQVQESDDEPVQDDPAQADAPQKAGSWRMSKPVKVARGKTSKPIKPDVGMADLVFCVPATTPAGVDLSFFSMVKAGRVFITPTVVLTGGAEKAKVEAVKRVKRNPVDMDVHGIPANGGRREGEQKHPRAAELIQLFDPILSRSASRLLSMDVSSLRKACDAIRDCDHDYLVKFAAQRSEKPVKSPLVVAAICKDAYAAWKAQPKPRYTRDEIQRLIQKERAERKAQP